MNDIHKFLSSLQEAEEDEKEGSVENFTAPTKEEWEFADEDHIYSEDLALDLASDHLADGQSATIAEFLSVLSKAMLEYNETEELEDNMLLAIRTLSQSISRELAHEEGLVMKPVSDELLVVSIQYMFDQIIKLLREKYA